MSLKMQQLNPNSEGGQDVPQTPWVDVRIDVATCLSHRHQPGELLPNRVHRVSQREANPFWIARRSDIHLKRPRHCSGKLRIEDFSNHVVGYPAQGVEW